MNKDGRITGVALGSDKGDAEQPKAHEPRPHELNDAHAEVTHAGLNVQGGATQALGEEVAGGGHVAGEGAATDTAQEGQGQQYPVGGGVVLDGEEPAEHGDEVQQGG